VHAKGRPDLFIEGQRKYTDAELAEIFADTEARPVFVAELDGRVVGYAFCVFEVIPPSHSRRSVKSLYIDDLCVDECCRKSHVGTALYEYTATFAKENGCDRITLNVWELNAGARRFYEKKGLVPLKTMMEKML
jgi:GNAT superfamily N-acetyltransferase